MTKARVCETLTRLYPVHVPVNMPAVLVEGMLTLMLPVSPLIGMAEGHWGVAEGVRVAVGDGVRVALTDVLAVREEVGETLAPLDRDAVAVLLAVRLAVRDGVADLVGLLVAVPVRLAV